MRKARGFELLCEDSLNRLSQVHLRVHLRGCVEKRIDQRVDTVAIAIERGPVHVKDCLEGLPGPGRESSAQPLAASRSVNQAPSGSQTFGGLQPYSIGRSKLRVPEVIRVASASGAMVHVLDLS